LGRCLGLGWALCLFLWIGEYPISCVQEVGYQRLGTRVAGFGSEIIAIFAAKLFQALHSASSTQRGPTLQKPQLTHHRDREWQKWPVTIVTGAYIGYAVGKLLGGTLLKGKKIMFD
jgi:hypothetical protein